GGVPLLFLDLDVDPSTAEIAWAGRVLDAFPQRLVIISTHKFLTKAGARFSAAQALWNTLVYPKKSGACRKILMILSGHDPGEGSRTDHNACGNPVHQLRSDYQSRPGGGDGWLRILTFHPTTNRLDVRTYSPTVRRYETDSDSQFTLAVPLGG
ncbi:MAG TPA: PKD domain-containing protein, partial [Dermatophilaceae bacterium]